jgi:hypothetical protein
MRPRKGTSTMHVGKDKGQKKTTPTLLELVLRLEGDFRQTLTLIRVTPLQAGVLLFFASSCGGPSDGRRHRVPPEAADVE